MANEILLNFVNDSSINQQVTLWQQPDASTASGLLTSLNAPQIPSSSQLTGQYIYFNSNNNSYYVVDVFAYTLTQYDSSLQNVLNSYSIPNTYANFSDAIYFNPINNLTYLITDIIASPRIVAFPQTGGVAYSVDVPVNAQFIVYDNVNNVFYLSDASSNGNTITLFNPVTNLIVSSFGGVGEEARAFDSVNQRLLCTDVTATNLIVYDVNPSSINYLTAIFTVPIPTATPLNVNSSTDVYTITYNPNNNFTYLLSQFTPYEIAVLDSTAYTTVSVITIPEACVTIFLDTSTNILYAKSFVAPYGSIFYIDCNNNSIIQEQVLTSGDLVSSFPLYNSITNSLIFSNYNPNLQLITLLPTLVPSTQGTPSYEAIVESMYGSNPYRFTKLYISTTSLQQANQPLTINYTYPDGRLNTDLNFPAIDPLQKQFVIPSFDLDMVANGQTNLQYTILANSTVTMIFTYEQAYNGYDFEVEKELFKEVVESNKTLKISRKNNPLIDMKWDL